tara:strand:- start:47 stop:523 length:477 start_codon:yes stop_codon:yes gene_type:complete
MGYDCLVFFLKKNIFSKYLLIISFLMLLYSCSPINKQHGYLVDDILISADKISNFKEKESSKSDIYAAMGSPSIEISDINDVWIYLVSLKEKKVFEQDQIQFQTVYRFEFDNQGVIKNLTVLTDENFNQIEFSNDKTRVIRDAYGITDQLYESFTRGQ